MNALILYESFHGNTEAVARAIARELGDAGAVELRSIADVAEMPTGVDLLVVGGPTYAHGVEQAMKTFLDRIPSHALDGVPAAAFDTRLRWPKLLSGAASGGIAERLERKGALVVTDPESFLVTERDGPLVDGEVERAGQWGRHLFEAWLHRT